MFIDLKCYLKQLKEELSADEYKAMVYRFMEFEKSMSTTKITWKTVWGLLHKMHMNKEDRARRHRILFIHTMLSTISNSKLPVTNESEYRPLTEWPSIQNREEVWRCAIHYLRTKWTACSAQRVQASVSNVQCGKCKYEFPTHFADCVCPSCMLAGGVCDTKKEDAYDQTLCVRCSFFDVLKDRDCRIKDISSKCSKLSPSELAGYLELRQQYFEDNQLMDDLDDEDDDDEEDDEEEEEDEDEEEDEEDEEEESQKLSIGCSYANGSYHLSWALFHHLPNRVPYTMQQFNPMHLCSQHQNPPCRRYECRVAFHILYGIYPPNFSNYLCRNYHPLTESERKELRLLKHMALTHIIKKASEANVWPADKQEVCKNNSFGAIDFLWSSDDTDYTLLGDMGSAFAECYLKEERFLYDDTYTRFFMIDGKDIFLNEESFQSFLYEVKAHRKMTPISLKKINAIKDGNVLADQLNLLRIVFEENQADTTCLKKAKKQLAAAAEVTTTSEAAQQTCPVTTTVSTSSKPDKTENQIKSDALSEAIKLAVNQKINQ